MTQEGKAKRYDDLLVKLQKAKEDNNVCDERYCCVINSIVPELKESEDERIRKKLLALIEWSKSYTASSITTDEAKEMAAWLEKQGETFTKKDVDDAYLKGICDAKHELEKQGEKGTNGNEREIPNSAWSEEDEKLYKSALWHIKNSCGNGGKNSGEFEVYNWLKSLRPQTTWKPSDEQIESDFVVNHLKKHNRTPTFIDAIEYGMRLQKEQMMAKAIDGYVIEDIEEGNGDFLLSAEYLPKSMGLKDRQKVKVIVINED